MNNLEDQLNRIEQKLDRLLAAMSKGGATNGAAPARAGGGNTGSDIDADIDGPRGDPEVRFVPKRWTGQDFKGQKYSACEPEFLDMLSESLDWFANRDDESGAVDKNGGPKSKWGRLDAARARAWAARLRGGDAAPAPRRNVAPSSNGGGFNRSSSPSMSGGNGGGRQGSGAPAYRNDFVDQSGADDDIPF